MACTLTIDSITGAIGSGGLAAITVQGAAVDCASVTVGIMCEPFPTRKLESVPVVGGVWTAEYPPTDVGCGCDDLVQIYVECDDGKESCIESARLIMDCSGGGAPPATCPSIQWTTLDPGDCNDDGTGTRQVTIEATLNALAPAYPGTYTAELRDSSGVVLDLQTAIGTISVLTGNGAYSGTEVFTVVILNPTGCHPQQVPLTIPECPPPPGGCPSFESSGYELGECDGAGNREVTVRAVVSSSDPYTVELRDETSGTDIKTVFGPGTKTIEHTGMYPVGSSHSFWFDVTDPPGEVCGDLRIPVEALICEECPEIDLQYELGDCDEDDNRSVTVTAALSSADPYTAELRDPDGTTVDTVSTTGPSSLTHTEAYPVGTTQTFSVAVTEPVGCAGDEVTVPVDSCDGGGGNGGCLCSVLFFSFIAMAIAAVALIIAAACSGVVPITIVAVVVAVIALILLILWLVLCGGSHCNVLRWLLNSLLLATPILLTAAGILAAAGVPSCGVGALISGGYLGVLTSVVYYAAVALGCVRWRGTEP